MVVVSFCLLLSKPYFLLLSLFLSSSSLRFPSTSSSQVPPSEHLSVYLSIHLSFHPSSRASSAPLKSVLTALPRVKNLIGNLASRYLYHCTGRDSHIFRNSKPQLQRPAGSLAHSIPVGPASGALGRHWLWWLHILDPALPYLSSFFPGQYCDPS